ncbi:MAG: hypothetical protein ACR2H1_14910 [Limisphaerales bacterium]
MKIKLFAPLAVLGLSILITGCVSTVDGHSRAGIPFGKDRMEGRYERSVAQIIEASKVVLARNGQIQGNDTVANALHAKINTRDVWVKCTEIDSKVTQVLVQARTKPGVADVDLASEISKQIAVQLAVTP